jgi:regulation of enolase protein 1 (concanavalin A-like superfamily)
MRNILRIMRLQPCTRLIRHMVCHTLLIASEVNTTPMPERKGSRAHRDWTRFTRLCGPFAAVLLGWSGSSPRTSAATTNVFTDPFRERLQPGWVILREQRDAWRFTPEALEVRVLPGNMWGPSNDAKNTFVRPAPDPAKGPVDVSVRVENRPSEQYEQVDLLWYYGDSHQVKIGQELVDGQLSIVMGREEADRTRTIAIIPLHSEVVDLRLTVRGNEVRGAFRSPDMADWREVGACDLPVHGEPRISLQIYQGPANVERWARLSHFQVRQIVARQE